MEKVGSFPEPLQILLLPDLHELFSRRQFLSKCYNLQWFLTGSCNVVREYKKLSVPQLCLVCLSDPRMYLSVFFLVSLLSGFRFRFGCTRSLLLHTGFL